MAVVALQRRKPNARLCHPAQPPNTPPPYSSPRPEVLEEQDRVALIAFTDGVQVMLPSYEEATRGRSSNHSRLLGENHRRQADYRPLPNLLPTMRGPRDSVRSAGPLGRDHPSDYHRSSIVTTASSAITRDNLSLAFGSMDTVNASDGTSASVTIETYDSAASNPSIATSQRAAIGSLGSSNGSLATEDVPLLDHGGGSGGSDSRTTGTHGHMQSDNLSLTDDKLE